MKIVYRSKRSRTILCFASFFTNERTGENFLREKYMYRNDSERGQVDTFVKTSDIKIRKMFDFILRYIVDEKSAQRTIYRYYITKSRLV